MIPIQKHIDTMVKIAKENKCGIKIILDISPLGNINEQMYLGTEASQQLQFQTSLLNQFLSEISKTNNEVGH